MFVMEYIHGLASVLTITEAPLYRYPYRNAEEAFSGDWKRIGQDIDTVMARYGGQE